jgi:hypothetical protein
VATYYFVSRFLKTKFCGVYSEAIVKTGCVVSKKEVVEHWTKLRSGRSGFGFRQEIIFLAPLLPGWLLSREYRFHSSGAKRSERESKT